MHATPASPAPKLPSPQTPARSVLPPMQERPKPAHAEAGPGKHVLAVSALPKQAPVGDGAASEGFDAASSSADGVGRAGIAVSRGASATSQRRQARYAATLVDAVSSAKRSVAAVQRRVASAVQQRRLHGIAARAEDGERIQA